MEMLSKIVEILIYTLIGIAFCCGGYKVTALLFKKTFNLTDEIDNHNKAAGIMIAGMFIAIAIIMSGAL